MAEPARTIVLAVFPQVTQLDFTGPHQVLTRIPGYRVVVATREGGPFTADDGIVFSNSMPLRDIVACDVICVAGGPGSTAVIDDPVYVAEIRRLAATATWITSVCTGSLILGAAGLLKGKHAACHWASREFLPAFGATISTERVVQDGNVITGGGVTAGLDFALTLAAELVDDELAQAIQLGIEYAPAPPFASGRVELAPATVRARVTLGSAKAKQERKDAVDRAVERLGKPVDLGPPTPDNVPTWKALG